VTIPANTTGILYLPADKTTNVIESGMKLSRKQGIKILSEKDDVLEIELASGSYHFVLEY
jgi:alpha-L-rhamnosidase